MGSLSTKAIDGVIRELNGHDGRERAIQADNRHEMATDEDYYDGIQWNAEDKQELEERGQPANTYNECKPMVQWILGTEKRARTDWKIVPRAEDDVKPAAAKTKLFKYISDINKAEYQRSMAFADAIKSGLGWLKVAAENDEYGRPRIVYKYCSWREFWIDSRSRQPDYSDARYLIRRRYIDVDDAKAFWPDKAVAIDLEAQSDRAITTPDVSDDPLEDEFYGSNHASSGGNERKLVLVREGWYRKNERVQIIRGMDHPLDGQLYDKSNVMHAMAVENREIDLVWVNRKTVYVCIWINETCLHHQKTPYKHDRFPYVPVWGERFGRNGQPYGAIRQARDPQDSLNKRLSKALYLLCTRRVVMDEDAVEDLDALEDELARADSIIKKKSGADFEIIENGTLAAGHIDMANRDSAQIRVSTGVTGENLGIETNATSGIAMQRRQEQGTVVTTTLFDNLRLATQISGEMVLSLIEQFMTEQFQFRITGARNKDEFITINDGTPENDITRSQADFIVAEQDWNASIRQSMSIELMRLAGSSSLPPQAMMILAISSLELSDLPNKDDMVSDLRKALNLPNPNATEEEQLAEKDAADLQAQLQQKMVELDMKLKEANVQKAEASAQRDMAFAQNHKLEALVKAFETAGIITARGDLAPAADEVLRNLSQITAESQPDQDAAPEEQEMLPPVSDQSVVMNDQVSNSAQPQP